MKKKVNKLNKGTLKFTGKYIVEIIGYFPVLSQIYHHPLPRRKKHTVIIKNLTKIYLLKIEKIQHMNVAF